MVPRLAGKSLLKLIKRWPSMISKCVLSLAENLRDPNAQEYVVLGSCAVLASQTVLKHLTTVVIQDNMLKTNLKKMTLPDISSVIPGPKSILFIYHCDSFQVNLHYFIFEIVEW